MNKNILTFDEWAILGKDEGMEKGHHASVEHMKNHILKFSQNLNYKYSFLDLGCGNGWVVRMFNNHSLCNLAHGIDGAPHMIKKAKSLDSNGIYFNENIQTWENESKYDVVFSMETLYYFKKPEKVIQNIFDNILNKNGLLIIGIDHYAENKESLNWGKMFNLDITTFSIRNWIDAFKKAGFSNIAFKQVESKKNWAGTLIVSGEKI